MIRTFIALIFVTILAACAVPAGGDPLGALENAAVKTYRDAAALVTLGSMSKDEGRKVKEEADRISRQYAAIAIIKGLPQESAAVKSAREALDLALK